MFPRRTFAGRGVAAAAVLISALGAPLRATPPFAPLSTWDAAALERARAGAVRLLGRPECQRVLSDFTDPLGHTLLENLEPWQQTPSQYLELSVRFVDGSRMPSCRKANTFLVTSRGQPSVFVCPAGGAIPGSRFGRVQMKTPDLAEAMVIHEMLHTLGLGE